MRVPVLTFVRSFMVLLVWLLQMLLLVWLSVMPLLMRLPVILTMRPYVMLLVWLSILLLTRLLLMSIHATSGVQAVRVPEQVSTPKR